MRYPKEFLAQAAQDRNLPWSLDFVADTLASGRHFRILTLVDDFTRECLGLVVDTSFTGLRVAGEQDRIAELRGYRRDKRSVPTNDRWNAAVTI